MIVLVFYAVLSIACLLPIAWMLDQPSGASRFLVVPEVVADVPDATFDWTGFA